MSFLRFLWVAVVCLIAPSVVFANSIESGEALLRVADNSIKIYRNNKPILHVTKIAFNYKTVNNWVITKRDDKYLQLSASMPAAVDFHRSAEDNAPHPITITITASENGFHFFADEKWATQVTLEFDYLGDHFFGLSEPLQPDNQLSPDLTGGMITIDTVSHANALRENYASAFSAFYMSSFGYGAFFDTFARGRYDFAINGKNKIHHETGTLDWHIFIGGDGREIHKAYFDLIGSPKKIPLWALGPVGWRDANSGGAAEIIDDLQKMTDRKIPFTGWFVDRPYSDGAHEWSKMNFNKKFANPEEWTKTIIDDFGIEFMTWVSPATFGDNIFEKQFEGRYSYIDLSHQPSVKAYQNVLTNNQYQLGIKGHKIDRLDERLPEYELWHDNTPIFERRNKYAYLSAKIHDQGLREHFGDDQFTFARTAFHRTQPYLSAIWGGDPRSTWEGMQANFANAMRSSFMGFPIWGTDVGGYLGEGFIPEDLYLRWMQAGSMTGLFEIKFDGSGGEGRDRMPWRYSDDFQKKLRAVCEDRMQLLPYLYSLANTSHHNGVLMQPMAYRHLSDKNTWQLWDQFYLGDALLVAPVFNETLRRSVYLPIGEWRDFDDPSMLYKGGKRIEIEAPPEKLPRFVKRNSLFVSGHTRTGNTQLWNNHAESLVLHAWPGKGRAETTFEYIDRQDGNKKKVFQLKSFKKQISLTGPLLTVSAVIEVLLDKKPKSVNLNGNKIEYEFDSVSKVLTTTPIKGKPIDISIQY